MNRIELNIEYKTCARCCIFGGETTGGIVQREREKGL